MERTGAVARFTLGLQDLPDDGALRAGDALAVWPPVVGDGITAALGSGKLLGARLAEAAMREEGLPPERWMRAWRDAFGSKLGLALALHGALEGRRGRAALFSLVGRFPSLGGWLARATRS